jgi:dTDP-4-amino-4,6-dideoxygalactose transaminase
MKYPWHYTGTGPVRRWEAQLRRFTGMRHALLVSNATTGLLLVGLAAGLRPGDRFITTPRGWGGALAPWLHLGARVAFADLEPQTLTLDPEAVRRLIDPHTRAILSQDADGFPADDECLRRLADEHGLLFVYDGARSLGALRHGRPAGTRAHVLVLSFTHGKLLDVGEGGAILTDDDRLYERLLRLSQHPLRQKRELGLDAASEFALNARIHPAAALRGAARFPRALRRARTQRARLVRLAEAIQATGLASASVPPGIEPGGRRLPFAWQDLPRPQALAARLGPRVALLPPTERPIYQRPTFRELFGDRLDAAACPVAERELARRWTAETR